MRKYLIDWINDLDKYFEYEGVEKDRRVKFSCNNLKGTLQYGETLSKLRKEGIIRKESTHRSNGG